MWQTMLGRPLREIPRVSASDRGALKLPLLAVFLHPPSVQLLLIGVSTRCESLQNHYRCIDVMNHDIRTDPLQKIITNNEMIERDPIQNKHDNLANKLKMTTVSYERIFFSDVKFETVVMS